MCNRNSTNRQIVVSRIAAIKETSHAGKNEPRMSTEGAREQPSSNTEASANAWLTHRLFPLAFMVEASACEVESNHPFGKPYLPARTAPACVPGHRGNGL